MVKMRKKPGTVRTGDIESGQEDDQLVRSRLFPSPKYHSKPNNHLSLLLKTVLLVLSAAFVSSLFLLVTERQQRNKLISNGEELNRLFKQCEEYSVDEYPDVDLSLCPECESCQFEEVNFGNGELADLKSITGQQKHVLDVLTERNYVVQDAIQRIARHAITKKYGLNSQYKAELKVRIPGQLELLNLVFELFDINDIPFSAYMFLNQVTAGLWDGCQISPQTSSHPRLIAEPKGELCALKSVDANSLLLFSEYLMPLDSRNNPSESTVLVRDRYPHDSPYCLSVSTQLRYPNFYIYAQRDKGKPSGKTGNSTLSHFELKLFGDVIVENDVCIGKLTQSSVDAVQSILRSPVRKSGDDNQITIVGLKLSL